MQYSYPDPVFSSTWRLYLDSLNYVAEKLFGAAYRYRYLPSMGSIARLTHRLSLSIRKPGTREACELADRLAPELPFIDASGLTFMEMDNREDTRFLSRVYYLTDPSASLLLRTPQSDSS